MNRSRIHGSETGSHEDGYFVERCAVRLYFFADHAGLGLTIPDASNGKFLSLFASVQSVLPSRPSLLAISPEAAASLGVER